MNKNTMRKVASLAGSALFLAIAPGTLAVYLPWVFSRWQFQPVFLGIGAVRVAGCVVIVLGAVVILESFARFALQGLGTPAPVMPPKHLVVRGFYRFVRNPMYVAVLSLIVGQALLFGNVALLEYGAAVAVGFHLFVMGYEEPTLRKTFSGEYADFCANVPRWIPRLRPWDGGAATAAE
jgi:protein-S-isoprenylcysteine O-methyltransferase Ste14